jgi:hypothetical protein
MTWGEEKSRSHNAVLDTLNASFKVLCEYPSLVLASEHKAIKEQLPVQQLVHCHEDPHCFHALPQDTFAS